MNRNVGAEEKFRIMTQAPVERLICSLAAPTIVSMLISAIYNMADTFFISKISTSASGAVGISFSLMAIIQALGFTIGMGSGNYISRLLGQKERKYASCVAATGFFTALLLGAMLALLGLLFLNPLVYLLGATPTIAPHARSYIRYILIGAPYMMASFVLNNILRFQGSAFFAMIGIATGGVINIILDPIFIFVFKMGTGGAALATIISQFISFLILYWNSGKGGNIKIKFKNFSLKWEIYKEILKGGLPSFFRQVLGSISMICLNFSARPYGDAAIAAMAIVTRLFQFAMSAVIGFGQGFQPVCGFNYGARKYERVLKAFWFSVKTAAVFLTVLSFFGFSFSRQIISIFRKEDIEVLSIGVKALRFQCITFPLSSWIIMTNMLLQTIGKGLQASIVSASRQGLFFIPAVVVLPRLFGLIGVQISQPVSDVFSFLLAVPMALSTLKELELLSKEEKSIAGLKDAI
ncbi:Multidrug export protein MepA [Fervidicola ferrireducens]|uniref:Multidrug export protein MepA n=1 Tax=Fervidicola ferrireducens TaxID=520764 RepID=A0A140L9M4_9FIRM|nr:MATE family efflux transporter [Fervidicola ferrireducens]KXG77249.1 Multidrug export protein MepA [Fervidicola ferrireducens]